MGGSEVCPSQCLVVLDAGIQGFVEEKVLGVYGNFLVYTPPGEGTSAFMLKIASGKHIMLYQVYWGLLNVSFLGDGGAYLNLFYMSE